MHSTHHLLDRRVRVCPVVRIDVPREHERAGGRAVRQNCACVRAVRVHPQSWCIKNKYCWSGLVLLPSRTLHNNNVRQGGRCSDSPVSLSVFASMVQMADSLPDKAGRAWAGAVENR